LHVEVHSNGILLSPCLRKRITENKKCSCNLHLLVYETEFQTQTERQAVTPTMSPIFFGKCSCCELRKLIDLTWSQWRNGGLSGLKSMIPIFGILGPQNCVKSNSRLWTDYFKRVITTEASIHEAPFWREKTAWITARGTAQP